MKKILANILLTAILILFNSTCFARDLSQGMQYYSSGNYTHAERFFRQILLTDTNNNTARYMLAVSLVQTKKYNEAKQHYKSIVVNSDNTRLVSLSRTGLRNLGENSDFYNAGGASSAIIKVNSSGSVMIVDKVKLNDRVNTMFVFDTGATYTTISKAVAAKLGVSTRGVQKIRIMTGSGYINAPLVKIDKVEVKGLVVRNVEAVVIDLPSHGSGNSQGVAGLLGLSFLENFRVTVDRANGQITLEKN